MILDDLLRKLADSTATDDELLRCARWALANADNLQRLRSRWPRDRLPIIDDYCCVLQLAKGASGVVFKAIAVRGTPAIVAVKLLQFASVEAEDRFREREIQVLRSLDCNHVARYVDSGISGGSMYVVMDLVEGIPLDEYLSWHAPSIEEKLTILQRACDVVAGFHKKGVVHRDLKPKHILVDSQGWPWVVDFGLSAVHGEDWPTRVRNARTELGRIVGTVKYMAPEQAWGGLRKLDHRTDIWALGIILYELATDGDYPYELEPIGDMSGEEALLHRIRTEAPRKPRIQWAKESDALTTLISRCLAYEPDRRINSASTLSRDLRRCLTHKPIDTRPLSLAYRMRRIAIGLTIHWRFGLWLGTVSAVLLFLSAFTMVFGIRWQASDTDFGYGTRASLKAADRYAGPDGIVIAGLGDETFEAIPAWAREHGIQGVTRDLPSWRAVHGRFMHRLAEAEPRVLAWDVSFGTRQPGDAAFVEGAMALSHKGTSVALAVRGFKDHRTPALSPDLFEPIRETALLGLVMVHDLALREGEVMLALHRDGHTRPSLALSTFAGAVHPGCKMGLEWHGTGNTLKLIHYPRANSEDSPTVDDVELTLFQRTTIPRLQLQVGDVEGYKAFKLTLPEYWRSKTIPYEKLLTCSQEELREKVEGRIVLVGSVSTSSLRGKGDMHTVRYGTSIVRDVPGCFVIADAIKGLIQNRFLSGESPLTPTPFAGVAIMTLLACWLSPKLFAIGPFHSRRARTAIVTGLLACSVICAALLIPLRSRFSVYGALIGAAFCFALAVALTIEIARSHHRLPDNG